MWAWTAIFDIKNRKCKSRSGVAGRAGLVLCDLSVYTTTHNITYTEVLCYEQFAIEYRTA
jgi:hypothetical protein